MENEKKEKIFADGLFFNRPSEQAPTCVKGNLSIKVNEFKAFLDKYVVDNKVSVDMLLSKNTNGIYFALNTYKKDEGKTESFIKTEEGQIKVEVSEDESIKVENIPW